jgi:hypothetical protein
MILQVRKTALAGRTLELLTKALYPPGLDRVRNSSAANLKKEEKKPSLQDLRFRGGPN